MLESVLHIQIILCSNLIRFLFRIRGEALVGEVSIG